MEERADWLCHKAGELGRGGTPLFVPQEGIIPIATHTGPAVRCAQTCRLAFSSLASLANLEALLGGIRPLPWATLP